MKEREEKSQFGIQGRVNYQIYFTELCFLIFFLRRFINNVRFKIVSPVQKYLNDTDWVKITLSQETKARVETSVRDNKGNAISPKIPRFQGK